MSEGRVFRYVDPNIPHSNESEVPYNMVPTLGLRRKRGY